MVGKPAGPTVAPGGSATAAACVAGAVVEADGSEAPLFLTAVPAAATAPIPEAVVLELTSPVALSARKLTFAPCAAVCSWYRSDGTRSSTGTALPRRATAA